MKVDAVFGDGVGDASGTTWLDVTRELVPGHPNWPGDVQLTLTPTTRIAAGDTVNVMALHTSTHTGTHLDAPYHYDDGAGRLASIPLSDLMGPCAVLDLDVGGADQPVSPEAFAAALARVTPGEVPARVLIKTGQRDTWTAFPETFRPLQPALVGEASRSGVRLLGTDAPSVDAFRSTDLPTHAACAAHGVRIVEALALGEIDEGLYDMVCLPLRLRDADASPVRALLRPRS